MTACMKYRYHEERKDSMRDGGDLGFVSPCILILSNELIPNKCSN
jgi:hypothetical protein